MILTVFFAAVCFVGAVLQSVSGFGFGILLMSVLPHFLPRYATGLASSTLLAATLSIFILCKEYKYVNWRKILPTIIGNFVAVAAVAFLWKGEADAIMKKALGVFLILLSAYFVYFNRKVKIKASFKAGAASGALGGAMNSLFSMGGPPVVAYLLAAAGSTKEYRASLQAYFVISSAGVSIARFANGMITSDVLFYYIIGMPSVVLGLFVGLKLYKRINDEMLRKIIYIFMAASGAVLVFNS